ncbi:U-box domain-containing protein 27-like [Sesbania bispinosa]|nr:U-box domain-containing protein 27-like [Sesbania bispinosa]
MSVAVVEKMVVEMAVSTEECKKEICKDTMSVMTILNEVLKVLSMATEHEGDDVVEFVLSVLGSESTDAVTQAN